MVPEIPDFLKRNHQLLLKKNNPPIILNERFSLIIPEKVLFIRSTNIY